MNSFLNITYIQYSIAWENAEKNRSFLTEIITKASKSDMYVLPETFVTGFSIKEEIAETMEGKTVAWMKKMAILKDAALMGSLIIKDDSAIYNRMLLVTPKGEIKIYNKLHLFSYGGEDKCFVRGDKNVVFEYLGWKIKPIICYDLRFPVTIRNTENYDILICVANWPNTRIEAWDTLLKARAIENQCYVIGLNRVGVDGNGLEYCGHSNVYDALGQKLSEFKTDFDISSFNLEKKKINLIRDNFPFLRDRDFFELTEVSKK